MILGMRKKNSKLPPPMRNQAVQTVGQRYFLVGMGGMTIAGVLAIVAIASGSDRGMFRFRLDRCDCLATSSSQSGREAGEACTYGEDHIAVNIGWKRFFIEEAASTGDCLEGWGGASDIGSPFGDGSYSKSSTSYGNGASGAADACVGIFVVSAIIAIVMYKTIKMSYVGPGSIFSVGLHNISGICLLLSIGSAVSIAAFWGRIQGKLGSMSTSLSATLFKAAIDVCEEDWNDTGESEFCDAEPWAFEVPLYAGAIAIAHVSVMFLTSVWLLTKSAFVEGLLDGSVLMSGKAVTPRVVEYEQAVGRALATTEDPDYDTDNLLYTGEQKIMIRPYPLPSTVKGKQKMVNKTTEVLVSPLRETNGGGFSSDKSPKEKSTTSPSAAGDESDMESSLSSSLASALSGSQPGEVRSPLASPGPVSPVPKVVSKAEAKAAAKTAKRVAKKAAKNAQNNKQEPLDKQDSQRDSGHQKGPPMSKLSSLGRNLKMGRKTAEPDQDSSLRERNGVRSSKHSKTPSQANWNSAAAAAALAAAAVDEQSLTGIDLAEEDTDDDEDSSSVIVTQDEPGHHEKTRSDIDWNSIMAAGGSASSSSSSALYPGNGTHSHHATRSFGALDVFDQLPSTRDGLGLGAITEDPREDLTSEFTMSPKTRDFTSRFEV